MFVEISSVSAVNIVCSSSFNRIPYETELRDVTRTALPVAPAWSRREQCRINDSTSTGDRRLRRNAALVARQRSFRCRRGQLFGDAYDARLIERHPGHLVRTLMSASRSKCLYGGIPCRERVPLSRGVTPSMT